MWSKSLCAYQHRENSTGVRTTFLTTYLFEPEQTDINFNSRQNHTLYTVVESLNELWLAPCTRAGFQPPANRETRPHKRSTKAQTPSWDVNPA